jgi:L-threonylcarbamoyladenylate synthase
LGIGTFKTIQTVDIGIAMDFLDRGLPVAVPTETVYGLAANALNPEAVLQLFLIKNRPSFDPLIVHCSSEEEVKKYVKDIPKWAVPLMKEFWPGPLTILFEKNKYIPDIVTSGLSKVAIRVPAHPLLQELLELVKFPLAAPSANPFGYVSPTTAGHVLDQLNGKIPCVLDGGACKVGVESTIIGEEDKELVIYRHGGVTQEAIEACLRVQVRSSSEKVVAPGMLKSHYAPSKPLVIGRKKAYRFEPEHTGFIGFGTGMRMLPAENQFILSKHRDLAEAAMNLFKAIRSLDANPNVKVIVADEIPDHGLGKAINDRLGRASYGRKKVKL